MKLESDKPIAYHEQQTKEEKSILKPRKFKELGNEFSFYLMQTVT